MTLSPGICEYEYIIPMSDDNMGKMINDPWIKAVENKTKCTIELCKRVLNRRISVTAFEKFNIIKILGPNESSIDICNRLLEKTYPIYLHRKVYDSRFVPRIFVDEMTPDNNIVASSQRMGPTLSKFNGLNLISNYDASKRYPGKSRLITTPWQTFSTQTQGINYPLHEDTHKVFSHVNPTLITYKEPIKTMALRRQPTTVTQSSVSTAIQEDSNSKTEVVIEQKTSLYELNKLSKQSGKESKESVKVDEDLQRKESNKSLNENKVIEKKESGKSEVSKEKGDSHKNDGKGSQKSGSTKGTLSNSIKSKGKESIKSDIKLTEQRSQKPSVKNSIKSDIKLAEQRSHKPSVKNSIKSEKAKQTDEVSRKSFKSKSIKSDNGKLTERSSKKSNLKECPKSEKVKSPDDNSQKTDLKGSLNSENMSQIENNRISDLKEPLDPDSLDVLEDSHIKSEYSDSDSDVVKLKQAQKKILLEALNLNFENKASTKPKKFNASVPSKTDLSNEILITDDENLSKKKSDADSLDVSVVNNDLNQLKKLSKTCGRNHNAVAQQNAGYFRRTQIKISKNQKAVYNMLQILRNIACEYAENYRKILNN